MMWFRHLVRMPPGRLPGEVDKVAGEREVWASLLRLLPRRPDPGYLAEDGWTDRGQYSLMK